MPFDKYTHAPRRIAIIGGGISGMAAAWLLRERHNVVLFEAEPRLGGHARTVVAGKHGDQPVDTGFIVFNYANYPNLCALFDKLDVPVTKSNMSFGASIGGGAFEYGLRDARAVFAQPKNALDPRFLRMLRDIFRFNARAVQMAADPDVTMGELLCQMGTGPWFRERYIIPLSAAIWSTPSADILDFPAQSLVRFFENHALLNYSGQHQWYTVDGGSIQYVQRLETGLRASGVDLRRGAHVASVSRDAAGVQVRARGSEAEAFDDVIFATHSDISLSLLSDATEAETAALSAVRYQPNRAVLHADRNVMPKRESVWSSWNYTERGTGERDLDLTYWMNSLQPIPKDDPMFVTLNTSQTIREELIYDEVSFAHPVYDLGALRAQRQIRAMNGTAGTWFCGAWMRNGFHEDGFASAVDVVDAMAAARPPALVAAQ